MNSFYENIKSFQSLYIKICLILLNNNSKVIFNQELIIFKIITELVLKLQDFLIQNK